MKAVPQNVMSTLLSHIDNINVYENLYYLGKMTTSYLNLRNEDCYILTVNDISFAGWGYYVSDAYSIYSITVEEFNNDELIIDEFGTEYLKKLRNPEYFWSKEKIKTLVIFS